MNKVNTERLLKSAWGLAIFTVFYNLIEGLVSVYFGIGDDSLTLFGFGIDSFVETISATGICYMIYRMRKYPERNKSQFEILALKITGWCFYLLALTLIVSGALSIINETKPTTTIPGLVISSVSIISMILLIKFKKSVGRKLNSAPILADANCNLVCVYMSIILLISSGLYEIFRIGYIDILGAIGIIYFSIKEGREAFEKARGINCSCHDNCEIIKK